MIEAPVVEEVSHYEPISDEERRAMLIKADKEEIFYIIDQIKYFESRLDRYVFGDDKGMKGSMVRLIESLKAYKKRLVKAYERDYGKPKVLSNRRSGEGFAF